MTDEQIHVIGPKEGYSPQIGTLVSMMNWMDRKIRRFVEALTEPQLDHLLDPRANTIGALLLHLSATEAYYGQITFDGVKRGGLTEEFKQQWEPAMKLGDLGRSTIKGHPLEYYLEVREATRQKSLAEFAKRDDAWLMAVDDSWPWGPTNNYCKWFHVCEHESNHAGQIIFQKSRLP